MVLDFKFIVKLKEYAFWQRSRIAGIRVVLWLKNPTATKDCRSFVHKHIPLLKCPWAWSRLCKEENAQNDQIRKSIVIFASIVKTFFHSVTWLLHKPVRSIVACSWSNSSIHRCCGRYSFKGAHLCEGTQSPRHCQSNNDETITAYWAQLRFNVQK